MFSKREEEILKIIGRKKITIKVICEELFVHTHPSERPFDAEISVGNSVRRIIEKCDYNRLNWTLSKGKMKGGKLLISKVII